MRAVVVLCVLLIATSAWGGIITDDFSDGNFDGWTQSGQGNWHIEGGELIYDNLDYISILFMGEPDWKDYTISVRAKFVKHQATNCCGEVMALAARGKSELSAYWFMLGTWQQSGQQVAVCYTQGAVFPNNFRFNAFPWDMDTWYHLKLTADGNRFRFYVDDELVLEYQDSTYAAGKVGIAGAFTSTTIHFDDVVIKGDDVPDMNLSVDPSAKFTTTWASIKYQ